MVIFHSYVSLPEGIGLLGEWFYNSLFKDLKTILVGLLV